MVRLVVITLLVSLVKGDVKIWTQSTSLGEADLWEDQRLPCPGQTIVLPEQVMFVPSNFVFGPKTILPMNGMLLFAKSGTITITDPFENGSNTSSYDVGDDACKKLVGTLAKFRKQSYKLWYDPDNWQSVLHSLDYDKTSPVPHVNRVPCRYDEVVFPTEAAYKVGISQHPVHISKMTVNGLSLTSPEFRGIYEGGDGGFSAKIGKLMFEVNQSLTIHSDHCPYMNQGCTCGHDDKHIFRTICAMPGSQCPQEAKCSSALMPIGHCCYDVCGAVLHIDTLGKAPLDFDSVTSTVQQILRPQQQRSNKQNNWMRDYDIGSRKTKKSSNGNGSPVMHASRISDNEYQIVIVDQEGNIGASVNAARKVYDKLYKQVGQNMYLWMEESGTSPPSALKKAGNVFGILLVLGLIASLLYLLTMTYMKRRSSSFSDYLLRTNFSVSHMSNRISSALPRPTLSQVGPASWAGFARFGSNNEGSIEMGEPETGQDVVTVPSAPPVTATNGGESGEQIMSFRALQKRAALNETENGDDVKRSFSNPLFDNPEILLQKQPKQQQQNIYGPEPTTTKKSNPLLDVLVDISKQAATNDPELAAATDDLGEAIYWEVGESEHKSVPDKKSPVEIVVSPPEAAAKEESQKKSFDVEQECEKGQAELEKDELKEEPEMNQQQKEEEDQVVPDRQEEEQVVDVDDKMPLVDLE